MSSKLTINAVQAATVDIGDSGMPGTGASQIICTITARRDGRWECEGSYSTGCNQGYYQENYSYGPWRGRGATPQDAVADMVCRASDEYQADMRRAGHDALMECEDETFATLAATEADRIENVIARGKRDGCHYAVIAGKRYYVGPDERMDLRHRAVKILRRIAQASPLSAISDDDLMAEVARRGLILA